MKPWHDAPKCNECDATCTTPARHSPHCSDAAAADEMWCPSCGIFWTETSIENIAKAWWSRGAWEGHESR